MARQKGIIKLKGTIGDISFYKTTDGHLAREKGGVEKDRIMSDPAFQRTRENGSEFGRAGKGGKLIRNAIRILLQNAKDKRVTSRLTKELVTVVKSDPMNERGQRTIQDGNLGLIKGFDFNIRGKLGTTLFAPFLVAYDRATGDVTADLDAFSPIIRIAAPGGTTHFKLVMGAAELDFVNESFIVDMKDSGILHYTAPDIAPLSLAGVLTPNSTLPVIVVLGVEFYQEVNGEMYPLKNGAFNALAVVLTDTL
ncbi:hypothetical protein EI546_03485 [Aequorivita sp. H23M31]|uniref:Uncharacterized protein n=1 Tax=Aequorivita ciconiae TaxID=2494375 RepID=A0A410G0Q2_9FLAO|nr:hypothetical protein [Aequorivita sp. H23M31]QAA80847.1 hypothetical protein EI546_03485 [Aequorivita sp. H23M31]